MGVAPRPWRTRGYTPRSLPLCPLQFSSTPDASSRVPCCVGRGAAPGRASAGGASVAPSGTALVPHGGGGGGSRAFRDEFRLEERNMKTVYRARRREGARRSLAGRARAAHATQDPLFARCMAKVRDAPRVSPASGPACPLAPRPQPS